VRRRAAIALLVLACAWTPAAHAGLRLGVESSPSARRPMGRIVFGVTMENDASPERGTLFVRQLDARSERVVRIPVQLASRARKRVLVTYDTLPGSQDFELRFESGGEVLAKQVVRVPTAGVSGILVGVLGPVPGWLQRRSHSRLRAVELSPRLLPADSFAWPDVDAILWPDPRAGDLDEDTAAALQDWVRTGGRLLAGTAADQPRALAELGFDGWPVAGERFEKVAFGSAGRSLVDLARREPPAGLDLAWRVTLPSDTRAWMPPEALFETATTSLMAMRGSAPRPPVRLVGGVLLAYLLLAGPGEWLSRRRAARRGRRPLLASLRRPVLLAVATGSILLLVREGGQDVVESVRIDVIDVDLASGAARGRAYAAVRRRLGGWVEVSTPPGTRLGAGMGSHSGSRNWWDGSDYEPTRLALGSLGPDAAQRSVKTLANQWSTVTWRVGFRPSRELVENVRELAMSDEGPQYRRKVEALPLSPLDPEAIQQQAYAAATANARDCWGVQSDAELFRCAAASCDAPRSIYVRLRGLHGPDIEWPDAAPAWIALEELRRGPDLFLDGKALSGLEFTIWRVRLPEDPS
jgi:hypothetical protein